MTSSTLDRPLPRVVCVGGATVDRTYRLAGALLLQTSNPAEARSGFGGVARNVAENLRGRGIAVGLVTCVGADEAGRSLTGALEEVGIDRRGVMVSHEARTADYVAVLTPDGELALGVAAMAIFDRLTPDRLADCAELFASADWVFADCNLPAESLLALAQRRPQGSYRLAVDAVSVAKAARLPERLDSIDLLFLNRDEAAALSARHGAPSASPMEAAAALLHDGARAVVVTLGADGALAATGAGVVRVPAVPARVIDVTGAGDALIAAVLEGLIEGITLAAAVARGCAAAARTVESVAAVARSFGDAQGHKSVSGDP